LSPVFRSKAIGDSGICSKSPGAPALADQARKAFDA